MAPLTRKTKTKTKKTSLHRKKRNKNIYNDKKTLKRRGKINKKTPTKTTTTTLKSRTLLQRQNRQSKYKEKIEKDENC